MKNETAQIQGLVTWRAVQQGVCVMRSGVTIDSTPFNNTRCGILIKKKKLTLYALLRYVNVLCNLFSISESALGI